MRRRIAFLTALLLVVSLMVSACGSSSGTETENTKETAEEAVQEDAAVEPAEETEPAEAETPAEAPEEEEPEEAAEVHPYAWLGMEDMPECPYMDILATYHYIQVYDTYVMSFVTEETYAVDGANTYKGNENSRVYSVDGKVLSISENSKIYMEQDMGSLADSANKSIEMSKERGENMFGRRFTGTGTEAVPIYSDGGDTAEYEYYEFDYPDVESTGSTMIERYYMKDGDVFAVYTKTTMGEAEAAHTNVIKSMSGDIPEGTFDFPDLSGYEKYESSDN